MILGELMSLVCAGIIATQHEQLTTMTPCTPSIEPAITVTVADAQTGIPLEAKIVVKDKNHFQEELKLTMVAATGEIVYGGVFERPGIYTVSIVRNGYETFNLEKVEVIQDECHVITRHIQVKLSPL